jgi:1-acyl-sn-glycerol-3-phosphate acyltransferase
MTARTTSAGLLVALRATLFNLFFFVGTALAMTLVLPVLVLPVGAVRWFARNWSHLLFRMLRLMVGLSFEVRGPVELLRGPALIASKHQSAWDTIVFFILCDWPAYVMKKELMSIPVYGWLARRQQHIAVDRKAGAAAIRALRRDVQAALAAGRQIVVFPEGTRVAPDTRHPYQPGIAGLYHGLDVPVVPVAVNSGLFWPRRSFLKRPGTIVIEILPPIAPGLSRQAFMSELETRIETATGRLIQEARSRDPGL